MITVDLQDQPVRTLNAQLINLSENTNQKAWRVVNPMGAHAVAVGLTQAVNVDIEGHVGYYCAGMNQLANITVHGHAGTGFAENIMSGIARVTGNASQSAGASGHGGLVVIEGNASSRCGISMKGVNIVVGGSVGHMSAFMAQAGNLVVCGDAGADLGDSMYEAKIFVRGTVASLGSDVIAKEMRPEHLELLSRLLAAAEIAADPGSFRRYGSARNLYNFNVDNADSY